VEALAQLRARCILDGEAVCCGDSVPSFDRDRRHDASVFLYAFDLIDRRRRPAAAHRVIRRDAHT
jgi:hypothetical protein